MDHDVASGGLVSGLGSAAVFCVRVADVERKVEATVGLVCVDGVVTFRGAMVALLLLGAGDTAEADAVGAEDLTLTVNGQDVGGLGEDEVVGLNGS